jgi:hypothetical protein
MVITMGGGGLFGYFSDSETSRGLASFYRQRWEYRLLGELMAALINPQIHVPSIASLLFPPPLMTTRCETIGRFVPRGLKQGHRETISSRATDVML